MAVPVKRYQRRKLITDPASPMLYYLKPDPGSFKIHTISSIARRIERTGALSAEDVMHTMNAFVHELRESLIEGNKVKVDGLGTFFITFRNKGTEEEKDCTVKNIRRVNVRFMVDNSLRLVNDSTASTRGAVNNVQFYIKSESQESGNNPGGDGDDDGGGGFTPDPNA